MADNPQTITIQHTPAQAATLQELERKSQDRIRVYNPTEEDFVVVWGGLGFTIPSKSKDLGHGKGQQILPRYIARNYVVKMTDKILGYRLVKAVQEANDKRAELGQPRLNHWEERLNFEAPFRTDNQEARDQIRPLLWLGIEEEFGSQVLTPQTQRQLTEEEKLSLLDKPAKKLDESELPSVPEAPDPIKVNESFLKSSTIPSTPTPEIPVENTETKAPSDPLIETSPAMDALINEVSAGTPTENGTNSQTTN